jgi:glycosyltransferase involved in cell wall biosynthesis
MRVLIVHERYRWRGGEDAAVAAESALLAGGGIEVIEHLLDHRDITGDGSFALAAAALWSPAARRAVATRIADSRPDLMHVHNFFPLLSPSIYEAAHAAGIPVVQTLHNYRLLCPNGLLLRDGQPCELCRDRIVKWPGVRHRCYRDSRAATAAVAAMAGLHRLRGTWTRRVDQFVALTAFARDRFIAGGLPADRIAVSPIAVPDPGRAKAAWHDGRAGAVYAGRLSAEKGLDTLLAAWSEVPQPLTIIGDGPLAPALRRVAPPHVRFAGPLEPAAVVDVMSRSALLVFPSLAYENFPLALVEAMACGLPVLASDQGAAAGMVEDQASGAFAPAGDVAAWRTAATKLLADRDALGRLGAGARERYEARYQPQRVLSERVALYRALRDRGR